MLRHSILCPEIDDHDVGHDGAEYCAERLVFVVSQVGVTVFFGGERQHEAVGEAFVVVFGADVGAPMKGGDPGDFSFEGGECGLDGFGLIGRGTFFKLEGDDMIECLAFGGGTLGRDCGERDDGE